MKKYTKKLRLELANQILTIIPEEKLTEVIDENNLASLLTDYRLNRIFSLGAEEFKSDGNTTSVTKYNKLITASINIDDGIIYFEVSPDYGLGYEKVIFQKDTLLKTLERLMLNACVNFCRNLDKILNNGEL